MYSKKIIVVLCILYFNLSAGHQVVRWLESFRLTNWGSWGPNSFCPDNKWVSGLELNIESAQGTEDDTALNAIRLICTTLDGKSPGTIYSRENDFGVFRGKRYCPSRGHAIGFNLEVEPEQGDRDDTAAGDMKLYCADPDGGTTELLGGGVVSFGHWTGWQLCPINTAICGFRTQVESKRGDRDDTALNNVDVACCAKPSYN